MNDSYVDQSRSLNTCSCHIYSGESKGRQRTYPELYAKERVVRVYWHAASNIYSALIWNDSHQIFVIIYLCQMCTCVLFSLRKFSPFTCLTLQALYPGRLSVIIFRLWDCLLVTSRHSTLYRRCIYIYIYEMLGQISSVSYKLKQRNKNRKNMSTKMSGFQFIWKIVLKIKYQKDIVFFLKLRSYFYNIVYIFSKCWPLIVCQVTTQNRCSKCPPSESTRSVTRLIMGCLSLSKVQRRLRVVGQTDSHQSALVKCLFIFNGSWLYYDTSVSPQKKHIKIWGQ
jgi:hypothetical protein